MVVAGLFIWNEFFYIGSLSYNWAAAKSCTTRPTFRGSTMWPKMIANNVYCYGGNCYRFPLKSGTKSPFSKSSSVGRCDLTVLIIELFGASDTTPEWWYWDMITGILT